MEIVVTAHPDYIESVAKQVYYSCKPQYSVKISTDGTIEGPTPLTWETEDEYRREWCRKRAIAIIKGEA